MKTLEKETLVAPKARRVATARPVPGAVARPEIAIRARVVKRSVARRNAALELWTARAIAFAAIAGFTYVGSTLAGYVGLERARQSVRLSDSRAKFARGEAKDARAGIEALTAPAVLDEWARSHRFVPGEAAEPIPPQTPGATFVAHR